MPSSDLRPGMRGYGLTVFQGTRPERFDVEIVDVLHNYRPGTDMILIRPTHPVLTTTGSVAGMSGSPIYIDNKLIGAYAWGWEFGNTTLAGVTPIQSMMDELERTRRTPPGVLPGSQIPLPIGPNAGGILGHSAPRAELEVNTQDGDVSDQALQRPWLPGAQRMRAPTRENSFFGDSAKPLAIPFAVGGASDGALRYLSETLSPFDLVPMQSGSGAAGPSGPAPAGTPAHFEAGGSVTVALITGDISAGGNGTVTHVDRDRVLAFGHPMFGMGEVLLPAAVARVATVFSSVRNSRKMSEPIADLGALVNDRSQTIVLDEAAKPLSFPMHVSIRGVPHAPKTDWNVKIAYFRPLITRLAVMTYYSAVETAVSEVTDLAWSVKTKITVRDHGTLEYEDKGFAADGVQGMLGMFGLGSMNGIEALDRLNENLFQPLVIEGIEMQVDVQYSRDFYFIRGVAASRTEVDPGDTVQIALQRGQYGGPTTVKSIPVTIPRELAGREVELEIQPGGEIFHETAEPENADDLVRNLKAGTYPDDSIVVSVRMPGVGVTMRGRMIPSLPTSALDALRVGNPLGNYQRTVFPMGRVVVGRDRVRIKVRDVHP